MDATRYSEMKSIRQTGPRKVEMQWVSLETQMIRDVYEFGYLKSGISLYSIHLRPDLDMNPEIWKWPKRKKKCANVTLRTGGSVPEIGITNPLDKLKTFGEVGWRRPGLAFVIQAKPYLSAILRRYRLGSVCLKACTHYLTLFDHFQRELRNVLQQLQGNAGFSCHMDLGCLGFHMDESIEIVEMVDHTVIVYSVDAHKSGLVVSSSEDGLVKIWKYRVYVQRIEHPGCVWDVKLLENEDIVIACFDEIAYAWNMREQKWDKIWEVTDDRDVGMMSPIHNGVQYDYVFDVDIGELPYNRSDNAYDTADKWFLKENLPLSYCQQDPTGKTPTSIAASYGRKGLAAERTVNSISNPELVNEDRFLLKDVMAAGSWNAMIFVGIYDGRNVKEWCWIDHMLQNNVTGLDPSGIYEGFEINDNLGRQMTKDKVLQADYECFQAFLLLSFKKIPRLKELACTNIRAIYKRVIQQLNTGEVKTSVVIEEVTSSNSSYRAQARSEWNVIKEHDVLFLLVICLSFEPLSGDEAANASVPKKKIGLQFARGRRVFEMHDREGTLMNDIAGRVKRDEWKPPKGKLRTMSVTFVALLNEKESVGGANLLPSGVSIHKIDLLVEQVIMLQSGSFVAANATIKRLVVGLHRKVIGIGAVVKGSYEFEEGYNSVSIAVHPRGESEKGKNVGNVYHSTDDELKKLHNSSVGKANKMPAVFANPLAGLFPSGIVQRIGSKLDSLHLEGVYRLRICVALLFLNFQCWENHLYTIQANSKMLPISILRTKFFRSGGYCYMSNIV